MSRMCRFAFAAAIAAAVAGVSAAIASGPTVRFTSPASGVAIEHSNLWVSLAADGVLLRLDVRSGRTLTRIDVHHEDRRALGGGTLATDGKELWIAAPVHVDGDPSIGNAAGWIGHLNVRRPQFRLTQVYGDPPSQVAIGPAGVWVSGGHTVRQVNPSTGTVAGKVRLTAYLGAIAVGASAVWVDEPNTGKLIEIDPRTRTVRGSVSIGRSIGGSSLAVVGGAIWAGTNEGVVSVDQRSRHVEATFRMPGVSSVRFDGSRLWVVARDGVYSISGQNVTKDLSLSPGEGDLLAASKSAVWLSIGSSNSLRRIKP